MDKMQTFMFKYPADAIETCARIKEWCPEIIPGLISINQKDFNCVVFYRDTRDRWELMRQRNLDQQKKEYEERGEIHHER